MEVKIITAEYEHRLEDKVNAFIKERNNVVDIRYSISNGGTYSHCEYSAMIIMK